MSAVTLSLVVLAVAFLGVFVCEKLLKRLSRDKVLSTMVLVSGLAAVVSLWLAYHLRTDWCKCKDPWGYVLLALWVAAPPIWFLTEYSFWPPVAAEDERVRHMHDLSRNIWLALVAILAITMGLDLKLLSG
jgi:4-amino-4-deoxy-L-arabinose transferase-like glycosyltransferase